MKRLLSILFAGIIFSNYAFASNKFIPFTTIDQAQKYCPIINGLTFIPNNPSIPNSAGAITGNNQMSFFESIPPKKAVHPKNMDNKGIIQDAQFRSAEGMYGYLSNNIVTCLYSYTNFTGIQYALVMREESRSYQTAN